MRGDGSGNAVVYVLIVAMMLSVTLIIVMNVTSLGRRVTKAHSDFADMYDLARSGAENALALLNAELEKQIVQITEQTLAGLEESVIGTGIRYVNVGADLYGGDFCTDEPVFASKFAASADAAVFDALAADYGTGGKSAFKYGVTISGIEDYRIEVEIARGDSLSKPGVHEVISTVSKESDGASASVKATISCTITGEGMGEIVIPRFVWDTVPAWAVNAISSGVYWGESYLDPAIFNFYSPALPYPVQWEAANPILVFTDTQPISGASLRVVDAGMFYEGGRAVPSIIVDNTSAGLYMVSGSGNEFKGVIYSGGNVFLEGVRLTGSVIALGEVITDITSGAALGYVPAAEMLFEPAFADESLRRRAYDFFLATDFHKGGDMLNVRVGGAAGYIIKGMSRLRYEITGLVRAY